MKIELDIFDLMDKSYARGYDDAVRDVLEIIEKAKEDADGN